jgi:hypothetical protein
LQPFRRPQHRSFALWLALAAVLLRAWLPDGLMLERAASGNGMALAICYASPLAKLRADRFLPQKAHAQGACLFSAATVPALPSSGGGYDAAEGFRSTLATQFAGSPVLAFASRRPPARAPPLIS